MIGTPAYLPPEQIYGEPLDARADLYSLGVVLFRLVAGGRLPFEYDEEKRLLEAHANDPPPSARAFKPEVPLVVDHAIARLLAKSPNDRYPSAETVLNVLGSIRARLKFDKPQVRLVAASPAPLVGREVELAALEAGWTAVQESGRAQLLVVRGGEFLMDPSDSLAFDDERPQHTVYLDNFRIDRTEVTNAMYMVCVNASACRAPGMLLNGRLIYSDAQFADHPVLGILNEAQAYCEWVERRLPTEAEWEKAARGTDGRLYPWGNSSPDLELLNVRDDMTEVGRYPEGASPYGALDMAGNVWEWVVDWYDSSYYSNSPSGNPKGPSWGEDRVLRGAESSWSNVRASYRNRSIPDYRSSFVGFRCARSP